MYLKFLLSKVLLNSFRVGEIPYLNLVLLLWKLGHLDLGSPSCGSLISCDQRGHLSIIKSLLQVFIECEPSNSLTLQPKRWLLLELLQLTIRKSYLVLARVLPLVVSNASEGVSLWQWQR